MIEICDCIRYMYYYLTRKKAAGRNCEKCKPYYCRPWDVQYVAMLTNAKISFNSMQDHT